MNALELKGSRLVVKFSQPKIAYTHEMLEEMQAEGYSDENRYIQATVMHDQSLNGSAVLESFTVAKTFYVPKQKKSRRAPANADVEAIEE